MGERTRVRIGARLRVPATRFEGVDDDALDADFAHENRAYAAAVRRGYGTADLRPVVETWGYDEDLDEVWFERGCLRKLVRVLGEEPIWIDETERVPVDWPDYTGELYDYQERAATNALVARQCVLLGGCGSGKTEILLAAIYRAGQRALVLVDTKDLQRQWIDRFLSRFDADPYDVGAVGGVANESRGGDWSVVRRGSGGRVLTVATAQTLRNRPEEAEGYGTVAADEVHLWAARSFLEVIAPTRSAYRIGATATLQRADGLVGVILDVFGEVAYEVTERELLDAGVLQEAGIVLVPTDFTTDATPRRRRIGRVVRYAALPWNEIVDRMIADPDRHARVLSTCRRALAEGPSLVLSLRRGYAMRVGANLSADGYRIASVFGGTARASDCLACGYFPTTESKRRVCPECGAELLPRAVHNERALAALEAGDVRAVVATSVADKGLDAPSASRAVVVLPTAGGKASKVSARFQQQLGRLKRVADGKGDSRLYYLSDERMHFGKERARILRKKMGATTLDDVC